MSERLDKKSAETENKSLAADGPGIVMRRNIMRWWLPYLTLCSLHYGKLSVTRRTFILVAKISTFVDILGLFDQVEMYISPYFPWEQLLEPSEIL